MKRTFALVLALAAPSASPGQAPAPPLTVAAAERPLGLVQKSQQVFVDKGPGCVSCHHHTLPAFALAEAGARGVPIDAPFAREMAAKSFAPFRDLDEAVQGTMHIDVLDEAWRLFAARAAGMPGNLTTSAMAQFLASTQRADGGWRTMDARPPQSYSRFTATALAALGVSHYFPESLKAEKERVLSRARDWLAASKPQSTEDHTFRLLGLLWAGAGEDVRKAAAGPLLAQQQRDGGWSQGPDLASDAYSTGEALYALHLAAGLAVNDPAYRKGLDYLLATQEKDGSWKVESRMQEVLPVSPEYFGGGFPHGRNHQYSSIAGSTWAAVAVTRALPVPNNVATPLPLPDFAPAGERDEWVRVVLNGTAADVKAALAAGLKPDAKTKAGTTALMLAARDPEKVKLLLAAGADANARAESGFSALHVACRFHGNAEAVRLLLKAGAAVNAPKGVAVRNEASPLFVAATAGDVEVVKLLLDAGAAAETQMNVLGFIKTTALEAAVQRGDADTANALLAAKADPNRAGMANLTPLHKAVIGNHPNLVAALVAAGAKVGHADDVGLTALHYAAYAGWDNPALVKQLLAAGADANAKDKSMRTPAEVAKACGHAKVVDALAPR